MVQVKCPGVVWDMNRFWTANGVFFGETTNTQFAKLTGQIETQMPNWFTGNIRPNAYNLLIWVTFIMHDITRTLYFRDVYDLVHSRETSWDPSGLENILGQPADKPGSPKAQAGAEHGANPGRPQ